jgi:hypothetical protein
MLAIVARYSPDYLVYGVNVIAEWMIATALQASHFLAYVYPQLEATRPYLTPCGTAETLQPERPGRRLPTMRIRKK